MLENPLRWVSAQTKMKPDAWIETVRNENKQINK